MAIKTVQITGGFFDSEDCVVLKNAGNDSNYIIMALPFHEDTPNLTMTIAQAMDLRNALNELTKVQFLELTKEDVK